MRGLSRFVLTVSSQSQLKHREELVHALPPANNNEWVKTDIYQLDNFIVVKVDLPSLVPQQDFHVQCFGSRLLIKGERKNEYLDGTHSVLQSQRPHGKFEVFFDLPVTADMNNSELSFVNGVLSIKFGLRDKAATWRSLTVPYHDTHY